MEAPALFDLFFAQSTAPDFTQLGIGSLQRTQAIAQDSYETWNRIWEMFFDSALWKGLVGVGFLIAGFNLIAAALEWFPELASQTFDGRRTFRLFAPIMGVVMMLSGDGRILVTVLRVIRSLGVELVNLPLRLQIIENFVYETLRESLSDVAISNTAWSIVREIVRPCRNETGEQFHECMEQAWTAINTVSVSADAVGDILFPGGGSSGDDGTDLAVRLQEFFQDLNPSVFADGSVNSNLDGIDAQDLLNPVSFLLGDGDTNIDLFLAATQAAFVNGLEIILIGAFALSPIVLALLLSSRGGQALFGWVSGIAGLYATQLIYNTTIGMLSLFIALRRDTVALNGGDPMDVTIAGLDSSTFAIFISIMAPLVALNLGYGQFARALAGSFGTARFLRGSESAVDPRIAENVQRNF